jgi:hypothetical protein
MQTGVRFGKAVTNLRLTARRLQFLPIPGSG